MSDAKFWRGELEKSRTVAGTFFADWQENLDYYTGKNPDATKTSGDFVNVNVDFYETPDLQLKKKGAFFLSDPMSPEGRREAAPEEVNAILAAHRVLLNELLGPDHADVLETVDGAILRCLTTSGMGATKIGYQPTLQEVQPPEQFGNVLGLKTPVGFPVHECWYWNEIQDKKIRIPADFKGNDYDRAPWLAMDFRMPLAVARREFNIPSDYEGTKTRDDKTLNDSTEGQDTSDLAYVDGTEVWYFAATVDPDVIHPQQMRRHVLIEGVEGFAEKNPESPYQELLPDGRLSGDSMIGNPIHIFTVRRVPDSAYVPSDGQMRRPLVRELCKFRTQMVQERDANRLRILYDSGKLPPAVVDKIANGTLGDMIAVEEGALAQGVGSIMVPVTQGTSPRQTYLANDYIQQDIAKTSGIDASGAGVSDDADESATKTAVIDKQRNVRLDKERRKCLRAYLKGVSKFSALVCRYMTPQLAVPYIGQEAAALWGAWDKKSNDGRIAFDAKPDSQIHLDAAEERKYWLDMYQFTAKDPNVVRVQLLHKLFQISGENPDDFVVAELPEQKPDPNIGFTFKGEDLIGPQAAMVIEILAQGGIQISQEARDESAGQLFKQMALGVRDASGKAVPTATSRPQGHGGTADQVRPLSKQSADQSGQRSGPKTQESPN